MARPTEPALLAVTDFCTTAALAIPVSGLLDEQPDLATARMTADDWQVALDTYLASPRP